MHIVLGATGHVGSGVAERLLDLGEQVTVVSRSGSNANAALDRGARLAQVDVLDVEALRGVFRTGRRAFLLNPPADPSTDTDSIERETASAIVAALEDSALELVVMQSTYGARPGAHNGDLGVLHEMERSLHAQPIPVSVLRAAYYMSNWDLHLDAARADGALPSFFPKDFEMPMVSPRDLGRVAARLLLEPPTEARTVHVEGPRRYSANDVARELSRHLQRHVEVAEVTKPDWPGAFRKLGFSGKAAASYAEMTRLTLEEPLRVDGVTFKGATTLGEHFAHTIDALQRRPAEP